MLEKRNCQCGKQDFDLLTNQNMIINGPDIHQRIVNNYIQYSKKYWIDVKKRQLTYLANKRSNNISDHLPTVKTVALEPEVILEKPKTLVLEKPKNLVLENSLKNISCWAKCICPRF